MNTLFPDHFIDLSSCKAQRELNFNAEADSFLSVLNEAQGESDVQRYIKKNKKWFIPGSLLRDYDFGHHEAYIIPEQSLGSQFRTDYMLVGKNSIGFQIVLVEFEDVNVNYKVANSNMESQPVRNGLIQIQDWKRWMDDYRQYFLDSSGLKGVSDSIKTWGIHYCLVVGRRKRMNDVANQMRGQRQWETPNLTIVTYDRLVDNIRKISNGF